MNGTVREWIDKGEADFATAQREIAVQDNPNWDAVCFHAQQCIEKLMKAAVIHLGAVPPKTHDLVNLREILTDLHPSWSWSVEELRFLSRAAVAFRYPGESADRQDAAESFRLAGRVREALLQLLGVNQD